MCPQACPQAGCKMRMILQEDFEDWTYTLREAGFESWTYTLREAGFESWTYTPREAGFPHDHANAASCNEASIRK